MFPFLVSGAGLAGDDVTQAGGCAPQRLLRRRVVLAPKRLARFLHGHIRNDDRAADLGDEEGVGARWRSGLAGLYGGTGLGDGRLHVAQGPQRLLPGGDRRALRGRLRLGTRCLFPRRTTSRGSQEREGRQGGRDDGAAHGIEV